TIVGKHHRPRALCTSCSTKIENLSTTLLLQNWPDSARTEESGTQVVVQLRVPVGYSQFVRRAILCQTTCEVDEYVDAPISGERLLHERICSLFGCQVS